MLGITNQFAQKMIFIAFQIWTTEKAELFQKHMEPVLYQDTLSEEQTRIWADKFCYLPPNNVIKQSKINKATYQQ